MRGWRLLNTTLRLPIVARTFTIETRNMRGVFWAEHLNTKVSYINIHVKLKEPLYCI